MVQIKSALITGANGYIGSNLTKKLINDGVKVHIIIRPNSNMTLIKDIYDNKDTDFLSEGKLNIHIYNGDTMELIEIIRKAQPEIIFHLASLFISDHKPDEIGPLIESNILFGTKLLEAAVNAEVKYFINTGTHWQHFNTGAYCPADLYAATKQAYEDIAQYYISAYNMRFVTLKLIDTYGPFDPRPKILSVLKKAAKTGGVIKMSKGKQQLGLLYIDDVVKAFISSAEYVYKMHSHTYKSFAALPKEIYDLKEVTEVFEKVWGTKLNIDFGAHPYKKREVMKLCCEDENILSEVNTTLLYDGLKKVFEAESIN